MSKVFSILVPGLSPRPTPELEAMQKQENDYLDGYLNLQHYSEIELIKKRKMDDDMVGTQTTVSSLTNVSPKSRASMGTAWTKKCNTQKRLETEVQDVAPMDFKTAETERMDDFVRESQQHKKNMERMGNELPKLNGDIATLTASQEAQKDTDRKREKWEHKMDTQMEESRADRKEMKSFMQQILMTGQTSTSPANLGFTNNGTVTSITRQTNVVIPVTQQGQHPDPPPHRYGKI